MGKIVERPESSARGKLTILSRESRPFADRIEAGSLLAKELLRTGAAGERPVVLGILRGGIVVAREIALRLKCPLDLVLARKLGAPGNPELAIGAITEHGHLFLNRPLAAQVGADAAYLEREQTDQLAVIARRVGLFRREFPKLPLAGRNVILTDDGVATGATMQAAIWAVNHERPRRLLVALPVAPADSLESLARDADELLCLRVPAFFSAVGQFYVRFAQTEDAEVLAILREERTRGEQ